MAAERSMNRVSYDLSSLLSSEERDFLVRNNGDQVKIKDLSGKTVGLYFSASWCGPCRAFTPQLIETYNQLSSKRDFEVVLISSDRDEESFMGYFSNMPWLAIPFSDSAALKTLKEQFNVATIPCLVILDGDGNVLTTEGRDLVREYQEKAYPFTHKRIKQLRHKEEEAKKCCGFCTIQ